MCNKSSGIHLCTCSIINKKKYFLNDSKDNLLLIKWTLYRFIKEEWIGMDGMMLEPVEGFTEMITSEYLKDQLNKRNCFDFEYYPNEGDNIIFNVVIHTKSGKKIKKNSQYEYKYVSLIYREHWFIDTYNPFYNIKEEIKNGFLMLGTIFN